MVIQRIKLVATFLSLCITSVLLSGTLYLVRTFNAEMVNDNYLWVCYLILSTAVINIVFSWIPSRFWLSLLVFMFALLNPLLMTLNAQRALFAPFVLLYVSTFLVLFLCSLKKRNTQVLTHLNIEKSEEEINKLEKNIASASSALEQYFSRYSNYFNLREVANKFSTSLSLKRISHLVVDQTLTMLKKGDVCVLYLSDLEENILSLIATKNVKKGQRVRSKIGTIFDRWALKTRQNLIIADTEKDFRFDTTRFGETDRVRSLIAAPLLHGRRAIGTIRINASEPNVFTTDDLRILNIMAVLASSAIGNTLLYQQTEELAIRDSLTNLYVQRYFKDRLKEEHKRALITNAPLSLLMCDLDHFKSYNDQHGHAAGDLALQTVAQVLAVLLGDQAIVARYGGEEFAILLPKIPKHNAYELAEEVRQKVAEEVVDLRGVLTSISVSIGVSSLPDDTLDAEELISKADRCLYDAKRKGRNRVC